MEINKWRPEKKYDFLIIGSGMGGASTAYALKDSGFSVLMVERGEYIPQEKSNWDIKEISLNRKYAADEFWLDSEDNPFRPRIYYNVGGNTKFFGGAALRLRESDFRDRTTPEGFSVRWPVTYRDLAPWYDRAEQIMGVRGRKGEDPSEPERGEYPGAPVEHENVAEELSRKFREQGLHPFHLPLAIDSGPGGRCRKGSPCDGFPCLVRAKADAENAFLRPLLSSGSSSLTLLTGARAEKLIPSENGRSIRAVSLLVEGKRYIQQAGTVIVSAGAVNSAALLLGSGNERYPEGLANTSGLVGRHYMAHRNTVLMAVSPFRKNPTVFQKTLAVNDYYEQGWGNIQLRGKVHPEMLKSRSSGFLKLAAGWAAPRSVDFWLMTEDFPDPGNRVLLTGNSRIKLIVRENNREAHRRLVNAATRMMRRAGYPLIFTDKRGITAVQHQIGTTRFGDSSRTAVLDPWCRSYDIPNLFVVDGGFLPSSGAVNPSLTIAAQGLRVGQYLSGRPRF